MESLLERIEENKLDALYLFINETLRDRTEFDRFFVNLLSVLPHNWSIQRVEVGHEFLSMVTPRRSKQHDLFHLICGLESLRTLIISDGYVPRKDNGSVDTGALLQNLPRARNLVNLDFQRLRLDDATQIESLSDVFASMEDSLEEIRITGISLGRDAPTLDEVIQVCVEMEHLRSLAISSQSRCHGGGGRRRRHRHRHDGVGGGQGVGRDAAVAGQGQGVHPAAAAGDDDGGQGIVVNNHEDNAIAAGGGGGGGGGAVVPAAAAPLRPPPVVIPNVSPRTILSQHVLLDLCQKSTTLQDLALRAMHLDDETCQTIATALTTNTFLTSLDIRQNPAITKEGYDAILHALERNYDLWCSVMVDNQSYQAKFNALIELNQANRGDLVRNPTREKLATFLERLNDNGNGDGTSLWYFLTIHDSMLHPLAAFLKWKAQKEARETAAAASAAAAAVVTTIDDDRKRPAIDSDEMAGVGVSPNNSNVIKRSKKAAAAAAAGGGGGGDV